MIDLILLALSVFTLWAIGGLVVAIVGGLRYGPHAIMTDAQIKATCKSWYAVIPMLRGKYDPK